MKSLFKVTL
ncbi:hypothetical protein INF68_19340, partial [Enterobacter cloacae complex sp. P16RS2]|nr:hypothetical protein [Enterobacter cloacae complex sp. P16RS2]